MALWGGRSDRGLSNLPHCPPRGGRRSAGVSRPAGRRRGRTAAQPTYLDRIAQSLSFAFDAARES